MLTTMEKSPPLEKKFLRGGSNPWCWIKQDSKPNTLPMNYSRPQQPSNMQSVSQRQICLCFCTCCHTETKAADQTPSHNLLWLLYMLPHWNRSCTSNSQSQYTRPIFKIFKSQVWFDQIKRDSLPVSLAPTTDVLRTGYQNVFPKCNIFYF